jgi:Tol biopolymer transport system component
MPLAPGVRLGPYEILSAIGAGGMGEVYRASDSRLNRHIAIKVLPTAYSADPERLQRFEQEARSAAALNHPHILAVHDIGQQDGAPYIVSELLEGETLRERLNAGAIPVRRAVEYAIQIAHGLAAAHEKGIVHRDLKPENIFITSDGRVKILDFGLAKLTETGTALAGVSQRSTSPPQTHPGMMLGTMGYMAPEQLRGQPADHRADVFAFGAVLYEMLAGRRAFRGDTMVDTITAILKEESPDLPADDPHISPALVRIVDRCLEKSPARRFQSAGDLAFALEALSSHAAPVPAFTSAIPEPPVGWTRRTFAWVFVAALVLAVVGWLVAAALYSRRPSAAVEATRFVVLPPEEWTLAAQLQGAVSAGPLAVSPDGRQVAFVARNTDGTTLIWVRSLDTLAARGLAGTEGGVSPFWSPDSRSIGFFADRKLKKIDVAGGPPITLCDARTGISGAWSSKGMIVFSPAGGTVLEKVPASGGVPSPATAFQDGETGHARPAFLPDGEHFVYRGIPRPEDPRGPLFVGSLSSTEGTRVMDDVASTNVIYAQGHLLFLRERTLMAQPFDSGRLVVSGDPVPIAEQIQTIAGYGFFSASDSGVLAYQTGTAAGAPQLVWVDRAGKVLTAVGKPAAYGSLALSPDGRRALVSLAAQAGADLWVLDLMRDGLASRFTFDPAIDNNPVWSPGGDRIVFSSLRTGNADMYQKASNGTGSEEVVLATSENEVATSWSADGRYLLYTQNVPAGDIWVLPMSGERKPFRFLQSRANEAQGQFSPDGRWVAYQSNESGRLETYVTQFNGANRASEGKWQVSISGGGSPRWSPDGRELFYLSTVPDPQLMAATIVIDRDNFQVRAVTPLFRVRPPFTSGSYYEVAPDGSRFLFNMAPESPAATAPITVVLNWTATLKR